MLRKAYIYYIILYYIIYMRVYIYIYMFFLVLWCRFIVCSIGRMPPFFISFVQALQLTAALNMSVKTFFWDVAPCILVDGYRRLRFICCLRLKGRKSALKIEDAVFCKTILSSALISICDNGVNNEFIDFDQFEYLWNQYFFPQLWDVSYFWKTQTIATISLLKRTCS
jgi:hypothetical protein